MVVDAHERHPASLLISLRLFADFNGNDDTFGKYHK